MSDCKQCGHCCTYIELPLAYVPELNNKTWHWLYVRGLKPEIRGEHMWVTIQTTCPELTMQYGGDDNFLLACSVHEAKPEVCKKAKCPLTDG